MQPTLLHQHLTIGLLLVLWIVFGLTGRSVWWDGEAIALGQIQSLAAGEPSAPYLLANGLAEITQQLTADWLSFADGSRLASGILTALALLGTALAAGYLLGPGHALAAALALMGAFGLLMRAHAQVPELGLMVAYAGLLYGIGLARQSPFGGLWIGIAWLALLAARGPFDAAAGLLITLLPMLGWRWRGPVYRNALRLSVATALLGAALLWWWLDPAWLKAWWSLASAWPQTLLNPLSVSNRMLWFTWPLWPLAFWSLWHERRRLARLDALHPILIALALLILLALWPSSARDNSLLPILVPLAILSAHSLGGLRQGVAQGFYWFGILCFGFFAFAFWVYFAAIEWGTPTALARHVAKLVPTYQPGGVASYSVALAATATLLWVIAIPFFKRATVRPIVVWATGMMLIWTLAMALFRPWVEAGWGYGPVLAGITHRLPADACLNAETDASLRTLLRAELGPRFKSGDTCRYLLIQGSAQNASAPAQAQLIWKGQRPRHKDRLYRLYRRGTPIVNQEKHMELTQDWPARQESNL